MSKISKAELSGWLTDCSWSEVVQRLEKRGLRLLPALIDSHVHFRVPGAEHKEDWETGSAAAIKGGLCGVVDMPNNNPAITSKKEVQAKKELIKQQQKHPLKYYQYIGARNQGGLDLSSVDDVIGLKIYYGSSTGDLLVNERDSLEQIYDKWPSLITIHAEEESIVQENTVKFEQSTDPAKHSLIRTPEVAVQAIKNLLPYVEKYNKPTLFAHISSVVELEVLKKAKQDGLPVYIEVAPHHLFLNQDDYQQWGNYVKVNPPLRTEQDNQALWHAINNGLVDTIATDHAPHLPMEKELPYSQAPSGIPEVDTVVPLMLNAVNQGKLTLERFIELMHSNPIQIFGINDLENCGVVVDMELIKEVRREDLLTKCGWTPYQGQKLQGWPIYTIINKKIINI